MELLERDGELRALAGALADVRSGQPRTLGVLGEAGIGKSALIAVAEAQAADAGLLVLGRERPFMLALDDLHWADAASIEHQLSRIYAKLGIRSRTELARRGS